MCRVPNLLHRGWKKFEGNRPVVGDFASSVDSLNATHGNGQRYRCARQDDVPSRCQAGYERHVFGGGCQGTECFALQSVKP
jgi:hypothetical protein